MIHSALILWRLKLSLAAGVSLISIMVPYWNGWTTNRSMTMPMGLLVAPYLTAECGLGGTIMACKWQVLLLNDKDGAAPWTCPSNEDLNAHSDVPGCLDDDNTSGLVKKTARFGHLELQLCRVQWLKNDMKVLPHQPSPKP